MKFSKILHPETALGLRGDEMLRIAYPSFLKQVSFKADAANPYDRGYRVDEILNTDHIFAGHICLVWRFFEEKAPIYHSGKEFTQALMKVDREIPVDLLPKRFCAYFSFPEGVVFDDEEEVQGAYVFIGPSYETTVRQDGTYGGLDEPTLWVSYITKAGHPTNCLAPLAKEKVGKILSELPCDDFILENGKMVHKHRGTIAIRDSVYRIIVNLVLYVNSIDCDLVGAPPVRKLKPAEKKERTRRGEIMNQCSLPVTFVSWNYKTEKSFHIDSTTVDTHMRWQRCGKENSQCKLIWVRAHERHFKSDAGSIENK